MRNHKIIVLFRSDRQIAYTMEIYSLLISDPETVEIIDAETGEIIYMK